jgi:hypothetical protein
VYQHVGADQLDTGPITTLMQQMATRLVLRPSSAVVLALFFALGGYGLATTPARGATVPTHLSTAGATSEARKAVTRSSTGAESIKIRCRVNPTSYIVPCTVSWSASKRRYSGTVQISRSVQTKLFTDSYRVRAKGTRKGHKTMTLDKRGTFFTKRPQPAPTPAPTPASVPVPVPTPVPTPAPAPASSRDLPLPYRATGTQGPWQITVTSATPNATAQVLAENMFNDPPEAGDQFYMVRVRATYIGAGSQGFDGTYRLRSVGESAVEYTTFSNNCGVIPDQITSNQVFTGGTIEGNVCWEVKSSDAPSLIMYDNGDLTDLPPLFFALH